MFLSAHKKVSYAVKNVALRSNTILKYSFYYNSTITLTDGSKLLQTKSLTT